jgi:uncharacterized protein YndB with AHSA1/START domain
MKTEMETAQSELAITHMFNAPRRLVFKAFTEAEKLAQWWGPKGMKVKINNLDVRPGGTFHYSMAKPDNNKKTWGVFHYQEIFTPEKIVFINHFSNKNGEVIRSPYNAKWPLRVHNVLTLIEQDEQTIIMLTGKPIEPTAEEVQTFEASFKEMEKGFKSTFSQLEDYLEANCMHHIET